MAPSISGESSETGWSCSDCTPARIVEEMSKGNVEQTRQWTQELKARVEAVLRAVGGKQASKQAGRQSRGMIVAGKSWTSLVVRFPVFPHSSHSLTPSLRPSIPSHPIPSIHPPPTTHSAKPRRPKTKIRTDRLATPVSLAHLLFPLPLPASTSTSSFLFCTYTPSEPLPLLPPAPAYAPFFILPLPRHRSSPSSLPLSHDSCSRSRP
jgi:hypothetical protein